MEHALMMLGDTSEKINKLVDLTHGIEIISLTIQYMCEVIGSPC
jgi:hypothetical protein